MSVAEKMDWQIFCKKQDLVAGSGVCALVGATQVALFYLPQEEEVIYALNNRDPIGEANVLSRGIVCDMGGRITVASPLYKQHFDLVSGECLEEEVRVETYAVRIEGDEVLIAV
jgi:NAD(P)H-dependent nitrite reductase small subunit